MKKLTTLSTALATWGTLDPIAHFQPAAIEQRVSDFVARRLAAERLTPKSKLAGLSRKEKSRQILITNDANKRTGPG